jgi:hypothetical protein
VFGWQHCDERRVSGRKDGMDNDELRSWFLELSDSGKQIFLCFVSHHLTIHGRSFGLDLTGSEQTKAFQGLNELQHQISGHVAAIGLNCDRYPDDVLWNILSEKAAWYGLAAHLKQSLNFARGRNVWNESR